MNWRPISEAPNDQSQVVWYEGNWYEATHFDGDAWITVCDHIIAPTLYLPINPPGEQQPESVNQRLLEALLSAKCFITSLRVPQNIPDAALQIMQGEAVLGSIDAAIDAAKQAKVPNENN